MNINKHRRRLSLLVEDGIWYEEIEEQAFVLCASSGSCRIGEGDVFPDRWNPGLIVVLGIVPGWRGLGACYGLVAKLDGAVGRRCFGNTEAVGRGVLYVGKRVES